MSAGFRACSIQIHREHEARAMLELQKHAGRLVEGSPRFDGQRLHFVLDLCTIPPGDGPSVECVILRAIERAVRPQ